MPPRNGFPLWFFGPTAMTALGGFIAYRASAVLPVPWERGQPPARPPRRVRLSWRAALRLPSFLAFLVTPLSMVAILRMHFTLRWAYPAAAALAALVLGLIARRRLREVRLLRDGRVAMAVVESRIVCEWPDQITYAFTTPVGMPVRGRGNDLDYHVPVGSRVPVYYAAADPADHVVATACWFEAD